MSFQASPQQAVENAGRLLKHGSVESVKLEGGVHVARHVEQVVHAGIPVMGHVGLTPQSIHAVGGFKVQGKTLAIEPMLTLGTANTKVLDDDWTVVTTDGSRAAHWEHTVAVTADGPRILTL